MTLQDPIQEFLTDVERAKSDRTHKARLSDLRAFNDYLEANDLEVLEVETKHLHMWLREESTDLAGKTVESRYGSVKLLYDFLANVLDEIEENPVEDLKPTREFTTNGSKKHEGEEVSYVTPEEVDSMVECVRKPEFRNELLIRLMFQTGMRRGEVRLVKVDNIDREARSIRIYAPKTDEYRTVFYQSDLDFLLDNWIDIYREKYEPAKRSPYLFPSNRSEKISENAISEIVREAAREAGIQETLYTDAKGDPRYRVTAHTLRHGHAVHALKSGVNIRAVAEHMGHSDIETTMQYLQLVESDIREAYREWDH
jgi:integrase/recombinase XerD